MRTCGTPCHKKQLSPQDLHDLLYHYLKYCYRGMFVSSVIIRKVRHHLDYTNLRIICIQMEYNFPDNLWSNPNKLAGVSRDDLLCIDHFRSNIRK